METIGLTPIFAEDVDPPLINECKAHLECRLDQKLSYGDELILIGQILRCVVDSHTLKAKDPYESLRMIVFLEQGTFGVIEKARKVKEPCGGYN